MTFLKEYKAPHVKPRVTWTDIKAFLRSNVRLGILGRERLYYWHMVLWTFFRRPELFSYAIALAICGHHLRMTCTENLK
jgi:hypothetical protein